MNNLSSETLALRLRRALYGHGMGDALGLGTEGLTREEIAITYPDGYRYWRDMIVDQHTRRWTLGDYTDDTEQALLLLDSLLEHGRPDASDAALRLYRWVAHGGKGVGASTHAVTMNPEFLRDPLGVSERFWEKTGRLAAANGGLMRSVGVALYYAAAGAGRPETPSLVEAAAALFCRLTHFDPRCVASAVSHTLALYALLTRPEGGGEITDEAVRQAVALAAETAGRYDSGSRSVTERAMKGEDDDRADSIILRAADQATALPDLELGHAEHMGYTLKALSAAFWALTHRSTFEDTLITLVNAGGDADTNAAVAGSLLGSVAEPGEIPPLWIRTLNDRRELDTRLERLSRL